jgi:hypothetical protein
MLFLFVLFPNPYISAAARCLITQANVDWFHESIHSLNQIKKKTDKLGSVTVARFRGFRARFRFEFGIA